MKTLPPRKVAFDAVLGEWNGGGRTIEFFDDGVFTVTSASDRHASLQDEGTWRLCDNYPFEACHNDVSDSLAAECEDTGVGEWIDLTFHDPQTVDFPESLIFTEDGTLKLYSYNIDAGVEGDVFYVKTG